MDNIKLHLLIQERCHRVPLDDTIEELRNPSGILESEYRKIQEGLLKEERDKGLNRDTFIQSFNK